MKIKEEGVSVRGQAQSKDRKETESHHGAGPQPGVVMVLGPWEQS